MPDNDIPTPDIEAAKAAAKADRALHRGKPGDPRDKGSETADLDDPSLQENVEDET